MKVVVLGGGYAGITCALRLARGGAEVTLVNASDRFVDRIRLHEVAAGRAAPVRSIARLLEGANVELVVGRAAEVRAKTVLLDDGRTLAWDELVLALGSRPETRGGALSLDAAGAAALAARMPRARRVLVVGGGLTGIEAATEIAEAWPGAKVTLATRGEVAAGFTEAARAHVAKVCAKLGITVMANTDAEAMLDDAQFDIRIWAGGFVGATLPAGLPVETNHRGQVVVEPTMRALGTESIWVCGDLAAHAYPPPIPIPMGCKTAMPSAGHVANEILMAKRGKMDARKPFDFVAAGYCVSLGRRDGFVELASGRVITGRAAAWLKELICRFVLFSFRLERWGAASYSFYERGNVRALPAAPALGSEA